MNQHRTSLRQTNLLMSPSPSDSTTHSFPFPPLPIPILLSLTLELILRTPVVLVSTLFVLTTIIVYANT
jgi:hypothetical protein